MRRHIYIIFLLLSLPLLFPLRAAAQSLPVKMPVLSEYYRRAQLMGKINPNVSFTSYPLFPRQAFGEKNIFFPDSNHQKPLWNPQMRFSFLKKKGTFQILPVTWIQQVNSLHPAGRNNGAMVRNRGYETLLRSGVFTQIGPLSIQLYPEFVWAQNLPYNGFPQNYPDIRWAQYYWTLNSIDMPERYGTGSYGKVFWGQSSIRLTFGAFSMGFSTENLWWGPGIFNTLIMTNNAPGFYHYTFNTVRPVKTFLGTFEWQLIAGRLNPSGYLPPGSKKTYNGHYLYSPKPKDWRFISGLLVTWQPKWTPGLFLGFARTFQQYHNDFRGNLSDYFPVFLPVGLFSIGGDSELAKRRTQLYSVFFRWLWQKGHGEVYAEYGRSGFFWDQRDLKVETAYTGAFVVGMRKIFAWNRLRNENLEVTLEFTQLAKNATSLTRGAGSWYVGGLRSGYTHEGQLLGAGIGPGSNLQTLQVSWVKSLKSVGIRLERYAHNNDFFFTYIKDIRANWVDVNATLLGQWAFRKQLMVNANLSFIQSLNYQWQYTAPLPPGFWDGKGKDVLNIHFNMGITYRF